MLHNQNDLCLMPAHHLHLCSLTTANGKYEAKVNSVTLTSQQRMSLRYQGYFIVDKISESLGLCCIL